MTESRLSTLEACEERLLSSGSSKSSGGSPSNEGAMNGKSDVVKEPPSTASPLARQTTKEPATRNQLHLQGETATDNSPENFAAILRQSSSDLTRTMMDGFSGLGQRLEQRSPATTRCRAATRTRTQSSRRKYMNRLQRKLKPQRGKQTPKLLATQSLQRALRAVMSC